MHGYNHEGKKNFDFLNFWTPILHKELFFLPLNIFRLLKIIYFVSYFVYFDKDIVPILRIPTILIMFESEIFADNRYVY